MEKKHVKFVIRIIDENENPITKPIKVYIEGEIMGGKEVKTENRSTNIKETHIKTTEEKSVKAIIQAIDEKENPIGKPIEVYDYATIVNGEKLIRVKDKYGVGCYTSKLAVINSSLEEIPLSGVYGLLTPLLIAVKNDKVIVKPLRSFTLTHYRKPGEKEYQLMRTREVLREGEYVDLKISDTYREIGREGDVPIVKPDVKIRIYAKKLEKELYQQ